MAGILKGGGGGGGGGAGKKEEENGGEVEGHGRRKDEKGREKIMMMECRKKTRCISLRPSWHKAIGWWVTGGGLRMVGHGWWVTVAQGRWCCGGLML